MLELFKKGLFYTFSVGAESLIAVALLPILTSNLNPHDYGLWVLLFSFAIFLRPCLNLMFQDILRMKYFDCSKEEILSLIRLAILIPFFLGIIISLLQVIIPQTLEQILKFPSEHLWKVILFSALHGFYYVILALLQFKEKPNLFLIQQIIQAFVCIVGTLILLKFNIGWVSPIYARSTALFINCIIGYIWINKNFGNPFDFKISFVFAKSCIITGIKFLPIGISTALIPLTDRLIVSHIQGIEETSYLGIGGLFSSVIIIVSTGFIYAWQPILYKAINSKVIDNSIKYYSIVYFLCLPIIGATLAEIGIFIAPYIMKYELNLVKPYIIWLNMATVAECYYHHNYIILKGQQRATLLSILAIVLIVLNAIIVYSFVKNLGGIGAAWGTAFTYLLMTIFSGLFIILKKNN